MKCFFDTEFLERGPDFPVELISIGMVRGDGEEYYAVVEDAPWAQILESPWLMENVMPSIGTPTWYERDGVHGCELVPIPGTAANVRVRSAIAYDILQFCAVPRLELWTYFGAYDHVVLCQLFGRMVDLPGSMPMFSYDIETERRLRAPRLKFTRNDPAKVHNALEDARWTKGAYHELINYVAYGEKAP